MANSAEKTKSTFWDKVGDFFGWGTAARQREAEYNMMLEQQAYNASQAEAAYKREKESIAEQRAYETEMSNTAVQRATADMQAAGINPILAAGSAASTPSISTASGFAASSGQASMSSAGTDGKLLMKALDVASSAIKASHK